MVTKYPGAKWRPLESTQGQSKMARHDIICLHTMVGYLTSTDTMFKRNGWGGTESHFGVGGKWGSDKGADLDGTVYQWQDTEYRADANLDGNHRVISIETADNAPKSASDLEPWTPKQLTAIVALVAWLCKRYDIPAELVHDSKPGRRGIAYHRQGIDPWRVDGGEHWSTSRGKECPGSARIAQVPGIITRVRAVLAGKEDDVTEKELIAAVVKALKEDFIPNVDAEGKNLGDMSPQAAWRLADQKLDEIRSKVRGSEKREAALQAAVTAQGAAIKAIAANDPGAIREALNEFEAGLAAKLADLDLHVVVGDAQTPGA